MSIGPNVDVSLKVFVGRPAELERNSMTSKLMEDPRIDPRIKAMFGSADPLILPNVSSREETEEHTSELQSLMRISYAVFCLKKKKNKNNEHDKTSKHTRQRYNNNTNKI